MKNVCVFCGSRTGGQPVYKEVAQELGEELVRRGYALVYGGGNVGLMGVVADAVLTAGGEAIGVIPEFLMTRELGHGRLTQLHVVSSMHERKARMAELADGFIAMPGGYGTLEEFCEVLTWAQLGLHRKPHGLLNVAGYYDALLQLFDHAVQEEFLPANLRALVLEASEPTALLDLMEAYRPGPTESWLHDEEQT